VQVLRLIIENFDPSFYAPSSNAVVALVKMANDVTPAQTLRVYEVLGRKFQVRRNSHH
jgi:hypothetical protein